MSILELKEKFHYLIEIVKDDTLLKEAYSLLEEGYTKENQSDIIEELNENQRARLFDSLQQVKDGKVITNEELSKKIQKWLTK